VNSDTLPAGACTFERRVKNGLARIGTLRVGERSMTTPALLPVINPHLSTIPANEMQERHGIEGIITNAWILQRSESFSQVALSEGVHTVVNFDGIIVTDSGTFQSYVYGEEKVDPIGILDFQDAIGVDVATMVDIFTEPHHDQAEVTSAIEMTHERGVEALHHLKTIAGDARHPTPLNGPIQGGIHPHLRQLAAEKMGELPFAVHPIGGIVPLMEAQRYRDLVRIIAAVRPVLGAGRPIHLFGCGHPHLFALSAALGVDLFDSAAYALFARDGRLLTPEGTYRLEDIDEWPWPIPSAVNASPKALRGTPEDERTELLARLNLEASIAEIETIKHAIRSGTLWELVERRCRTHARLHEALIEVQSMMREDDSAKMGELLVDSTRPVRHRVQHFFSGSGEPRPDLLAATRLIRSRWRPPKDAKRALIIAHAPPPYRHHELPTHEKGVMRFILTPLGLLPIGLEDLAPWSMIHAPEQKWTEEPDSDVIADLLAGLGCQNLSWDLCCFDGREPVRPEGTRPDSKEHALTPEQNEEVRSKLLVLLGIDAEAWLTHRGPLKGRMSGSSRLTNVFDCDGAHIISMRLNDGAISLTDQGAASFALIEPTKDYTGVPRVVIDEHAVPFVKEGRNVFHGFVTNAEAVPIAGLPCIICGPDGEAIAHGVPTGCAADLLAVGKGMAVRVRGVLTTQKP